MIPAPARALAGLDELSPLRKQLPFSVIFLLATLVSCTWPSVIVSSIPSLVSGLVLVAIATLLAAFLGRCDLLRFATIVPALDFIAAGMLRHGTDESRSVFASIVLLPILWFAVKSGRRYVLFAALGQLVATVVPFALGARIENNPNELVRGLFSALVFAIAALVVNTLSARARVHLDSAQREAAAASEELEGAAQIQQFLLPKEAASLVGYETAGVCIPSKAVGGDFFDWYAIEGGLGFTLGDVMGKGAGAGMIAATTRAVIRSARNSEDPVTALALTADCLATELSQAAAFATLFHARLRTADGRVVFSDAGHGLTLVVRHDGTWERLTSRDQPVGLMPDATWSSRELVLGAGDMMVSFSDGLLDLYDGTLTAIAEIASLACRAGSAQEIVDAVQRMASKGNNADDVTVLAVRRTQAGPRQHPGQDEEHTATPEMSRV